MPFTLHVCIVALSDYTHCATSQVVEAALQCLKTNPAASVHALPVLKPALASLLRDNTPIQRPGKTSLQTCFFPQLALFPRLQALLQHAVAHAIGLMHAAILAAIFDAT